MESAHRKLSQNPRQTANFLSVLFFGWTIPIFKQSYRDEALHPNDAFEPLEEDESNRLGDRLEKNWTVELKKQSHPSLLRCLLKTFRFELIIVGILNFFYECVCSLTYPLLLNGFLSYFRKNTDVSRNDALYYGVGLFVLIVFSAIVSKHFFFSDIYYSMRIRVALSSIIYRKTLLLSQSALSKTASAKLVNLLSNDIQRFQRLTVHRLWITPITSIVGVYILWTEIRWAAIFGLTILFIVIPIQSYVGKLLIKIRIKTAVRTDERVQLMNEIVSGIQVIKMYGWERLFEGLIAAARRSELNMVLKNLYFQTFNLTFALVAKRITLFCTILSFVWLYGAEELTAPKVFLTIYLFNVISFLMCYAFIGTISEIFDVLTAIKRIQKFLKYDEKSESLTESEPISFDVLETRNLAVELKNVSAEWNIVKKQNDSSNNGSNQNETEMKTIESKPFGLREINLEVPKGKLVFVIGSVGAGKSTLMQVLLKELPLIHGAIGINGTVSFSSQVSWTFTSTIRQNITFGQPMDRTRYNEVINCADLRKDFRKFSDGDMTLVGENGAGLSGGQKARINLARAMYRKANIYLIDDPLSAVDTHVQSHLFHKCIGPNGYLARQSATRILITHQLHFLNKADWIVVLNDGKIETQGDYETVLRNGVDFATMLKQDENDQIKKDENVKENTGRDSHLSQRSRANSMLASNEMGNYEDENEKYSEEKNKLIEFEASSKGKIKGSILQKYLELSNITDAPALLCALFVITQAIASTADVWVSYWIRNEEIRSLQSKAIVSLNQTSIENNIVVDNWLTQTYVYIYGGIMISLILVATLRSVVYSFACIRSSQNLHDTMFNGLISTKMKFFDENPVGRITNRFTKDMGGIDDVLPKTLLESCQIIFSVLGVITVIIFTDMKLSILILTMGIIFIFLRKIYVKCSTNIKHLEGITKSPVFTHILATIEGLPIVRAFQAERILQEEFERHQNMNTSAGYMLLGATYGFGISLDMLVSLFIGVIIYVFLAVNEGETGDRVGLVLTQILFLLGWLQFAVRISTEVTNHLTSVERVLEYSQLEPEKQPEIPQGVLPDWPSKGSIEFKQVSYQYSADDKPVLRGLSFSVKPREKVSIVGRTGAGKSSLISSIFRLAIVEGDIIIDDVNTSSINSNVFRPKISIIPQEPTLFAGTLRRNLDPFEEYSDDDVWSALDNVDLKEFVSKNNGLQMSVLAHGRNFSVGQRQILCLARAILKKNRIIILDEATANVDLRTDEVIQKTIREKFINSTVLTVAHRLNTVIDSDRVLVMDAGVAVEFDSPYILMQNKDGVFRKMVEALGQQEYDCLYAKAKEKFDNSNLFEKKDW